MDVESFAARIDHTVLGPATRPVDARRVVREAREHGTAACVPPCYVGEVFSPPAGLSTVVGFPHGQHPPTVKRREADRVAREGVDAVDVVINVGRLRAGDTGAVHDELRAVVRTVTVPVRAIVETPLLTDDEKRRAGRLAVEAGAAALKTSTGFVEGGATVADVELLAEYLPVKASGGVGDLATARAMLDAGADRIGSSSGAAIVRELCEQRRS